MLYSRDLAAAERSLKELQNLANASIRKLNGMNGYNGDLALQNSVLHFLQFIQRVAFGDLIEMLRLYKLPAPTEADGQRVKEIYDRYSGEAGKRIRLLAEAEQEFLAKHIVNEETMQFCTDIEALVASSNIGFSDIKGAVDPYYVVATSYTPTRMPIHAYGGYIQNFMYPVATFKYYQGNDLAMAQNYLASLGKWLDSCNLGWKRSEDTVFEF